MNRLNLLTPATDANLSLDAIGLLGTMMNVPECDYLTENQIRDYFKNDSFVAVKNALSELLNTGYLHCIDGKIFAVNKLKIVQMKLI